jgi:hypothetical protein
MTLRVIQDIAKDLMRMMQRSLPVPNYSYLYKRMPELKIYFRS